jgi:hypothetical protein
MFKKDFRNSVYFYLLKFFVLSVNLFIFLAMSFFPKKNFLSDYAESFDDFMAYDQKPPANPVKHYLKLPNGQFFGPVEFLKEGVKFKGVIPKEGVMVITELANPTDIFCISPSEEMQIAYQIMYAKLKPEYIDQETKNVVAYILKVGFQTFLIAIFGSSLALTLL